MKKIIILMLTASHSQIVATCQFVAAAGGATSNNVQISTPLVEDKKYIATVDGSCNVLPLASLVDPLGQPGVEPLNEMAYAYSDTFHDDGVAANEGYSLYADLNSSVEKMRDRIRENGFKKASKKRFVKTSRRYRKLKSELYETEAKLSRMMRRGFLRSDGIRENGLII